MSTAFDAVNGKARLHIEAQLAHKFRYLGRGLNLLKAQLRLIGNTIGNRLNLSSGCVNCSAHLLF